MVGRWCCRAGGGPRKAASAEKRVLRVSKIDCAAALLGPKPLS